MSRLGGGREYFASAPHQQRRLSGGRRGQRNGRDLHSLGSRGFRLGAGSIVAMMLRR